ncbi:bacillithiol biosynthesis cysteine-adding enzyme BshC [Myxococcota bacterium]|nr:bacillithiol biosynthesis cysteine-adding enzyme BshC [Myxococcota bacterium]
MGRSGLFASYLAGHASAYFPLHFARVDDRRTAVARARARPMDPRVWSALAAQSARGAPSAARDANLAALRDGAACVVTGQQVGLFLGPLFTIYKAATAIVAARALSEETGHPVVPIFWLQTEDHDLPEIASAFVPGRSGGLVELAVPPRADEKISVAHQVLPDVITEVIDQLRAELGTLPGADAHVARLARAYVPGAGIAAAFADVLRELFAPEGLVLCDPRTPELAAITAPIHHRAITDADLLSSVLLERADALTRAGHDVPVHVRAGSPLSFFHPRGVEGPRYRLGKVPAGFEELGGDGIHTDESLLSALDVEPRLFSTSALLRPVLQDSVLPTAAYVGGPGEVAYFAQLSTLYRAFGLEMPLVVPRARFRIVDDKVARVLARLGLAAVDAAKSEDELLAAIRARASDGARSGEALERALARAIDDVLDGARAELVAAGAGVDVALDKTKATIHGALAKLREKYDRALIHQDEALTADVRRVKAWLFPRGEPQERVFALAYPAARWGERAFLDRVLASITPFDATERELVP